MTIVFLGPQGSGKGTQAALLARRLRLPTISTGAVYRAEVARGSALGRKVKKYLEHGTLVPKEATRALMRRILKQPKYRRGVILDGFPRTLFQARALDRIRRPDAAILVDIPVLVSIRRIAGRARIEGRTDDTPAAVRRRLAIYRKQTGPVVRLYDRRGLLIRVDGTPSIKIVHRDILKKIFVVPAKAGTQTKK